MYQISKNLVHSTFCIDQILQDEIKNNGEDIYDMAEVGYILEIIKTKNPDNTNEYLILAN